MAPKLLKTVLLGVCAVILAIMCVLVVYQVVARYVPAVPPYLWTEEISRGLLIWLVMIGAGYGFFSGEHFRMSALIDALPKGAIRLVNFFIQLTICCCGVLMLLSGVEFVQRGWLRTSFVSGLPLIWAYSALIVGGLLMALGGLWSLIQELRGTSSKVSRFEDAT